MLNVDDLKSKIISALDGVDARKAQMVVGKTIQDYIVRNLQIKGFYTGQIPPGVPDPLSGVKTFALKSCLLQENVLKQLSKKGGYLWYVGVIQLIRVTALIRPTTMQVNLLTPPIPIFSQITPASKRQFDLSKVQSAQEAWEKIAKLIVKNIKSAKPMTVAFPAQSSGGGMGTVAFLNFM